MKNELITNYSSLDDEEFLNQLDSIDDLISDAETTEDLIELEEMVGLSTFTGVSDWGELLVFLRRLRSPYSSFVSNLCNRWDEIEEGE